MKLTSTLRALLAGTTVFAVAAVGMMTSVSTEKTPYQPRPERPAAQPDGAQEIRRLLLGDAEGNIDHEGLQSLRKAVAKSMEKQSRQKANSMSWIELGPDNIGGRTRAIVALDNGTLYAGGVSGGLWKSTKRKNTRRLIVFRILLFWRKISCK